MRFKWVTYFIPPPKSIGVKELAEFGKQINNWGASDIFAGCLGGEIK